MIQGVERRGGLFHLRWDNGINVSVSKIRQLSSGDLRGQIIFYDGDVFLHQVVMNLSADSSREKTIRALANRDGKHPWATMISDLCFEVIKRWSQGAPLEIINTRDEIPPEEYLLEPLLPLNEPTILFGLGASAKSYLAAFIAICLQLVGPADPFGWKVRGNECHSCLYLDWETSKNKLARRVQRIVTGMTLDHVALAYRRCIAPLIDDLEAVQELVMETKAKLVIIDSAGRACGSDLKDAGVVNGFFTALRELDVTALIVHHRSKDDFSKNKTPFGSAYFENNARSVWQVEKEQQAGESELIVSLMQTKVNDALKHQPIGIKLSFDNDSGSTVFEPTELRGTKFEDNLPMKDRIKDLLLEGARSEKEIAEALRENQGSVHTILYRHNNVFVKMEKGQWGVITHEV